MSEITIAVINNYLDLLISRRNYYAALEIDAIVEGISGQDYAGCLEAYVRSINDFFLIQDTEKDLEIILVKLGNKAMENCESSKKVYMQAVSDGKDLDALRTTCTSNLSVLRTVLRNITYYIPLDNRNKIAAVLNDNTYMHSF